MPLIPCFVAEDNLKRARSSCRNVDELHIWCPFAILAKSAQIKLFSLSFFPPVLDSVLSGTIQLERGRERELSVDREEYFAPCRDEYVVIGQNSRRLKRQLNSRSNENLFMDE